MGKQDVINKILANEQVNSTQLAKSLGTTIQTVCGFKTRGLSKNYATKLKELYPKYSLQWILTGEGNMYEHAEASNIIRCTGNATHNTQTSAGLNRELFDELVSQRKMFEGQINRLLELLEKKHND